MKCAKNDSTLLVICQTQADTYRREVCHKGFNTSGYLSATCLYLQERNLSNAKCVIEDSTKLVIYPHTGEKFVKKDLTNPVNCSYLFVHIRIQTRKKPFKCENCLKGFSTSSDLAKHMRTHTLKMQSVSKRIQPIS